MKYDKKHKTTTLEEGYFHIGKEDYDGDKK